MSDLKLQLCADCLDGAVPEALDAIQAALCDIGLHDRVTVSQAPCLELCDVPVAMALQKGGGACYVFSGLAPVSDAADIAATCRAYLDSPTGWIDDARPCGRLRFCLAARVPA